MLHDEGLKVEELSPGDRAVHSRMTELKDINVPTWREHRQHLIHILSSRYGYTDRRLAKIFDMCETRVK